MNVNLKCFSTLVNAESCDYRESQAYRLTEGQTVGDLWTKPELKKKRSKSPLSTVKS